VFGLPEWASRLLLAAIIVAAAFVVLALIRRGIARLAARSGPLEPGRARQRQTAVAVFATGARYVVLVAAAIGVALALSGSGGVAALSGTALLIVVVGFAAQRLLADVIAGAFILFEGQYGVGDIITLKPMDFTGVVEELGLRATVVRDLNGDVCFVPNSMIQGVRRLPHAHRTLDIELVTRDVAAVEAALRHAGRLGPLRGARFATAPHIAGRVDVGTGLVGLRIRTAVAPSLEWLVRDVLLGLLRAEAGEGIVGEIVVLDADPQVVTAYQDALAGGI
jgi:small conductance mechanosensitive channel